MFPNGETVSKIHQITNAKCAVCKQILLDLCYLCWVVLQGEYLQSDAFYRHSYYIGRNRTP